MVAEISKDLEKKEDKKAWTFNGKMWINDLENILTKMIAL